MQISGIMTLHPIGVTPNQTIGEAAAIMESSDLHSGTAAAQVFRGNDQ